MNLVGLLQCLEDGAYTALDLLLCPLSVKDLKALGECSKNVRSVVLPYLFDGSDNLFISSNKVDLEVFESVVSHDILRQRVRKVVFDDSTYDERALSNDYWTNCTDGLRPVNDSRIMANPPDYYGKLSEDAETWSFWKTFVADHLYIRSHDLDIRALKTALASKLPNVKSIRLTTLAFRPERSSQFYPYLPPGEISPAVRLVQSHSSTEKSLDPQNHWNSRWLTTCRIPLELDAYEKLSTFGSFRSIQGICAALAEASHVQFEEFTLKPAAVYDGSMHRGLCHHFFSEWTPELEVLEQHFATLKSLTLSVSGDGHDTLPESGKPSVYDNLIRLVRAAHNLEKIYLDLDEADPASTMLGMSGCPDSQIDMIELNRNSNRHFHKLESITFIYSTLRVEALLQVIRNHTSTLRYLRIEESNLTDGYWTDVLDTLRYQPDFAPLRAADRFRMVIDFVSDGHNGMYYQDRRRIPGSGLLEDDVDACAMYIRGTRDKFPLVRDVMTPPRHVVE